MPPTTDEHRPLRILLVDDHELVRMGLRLLIETLDGVGSVTDVGDASSALSAMETQPVDLAIIDVRMPYVSGADLTREVKARWPGTPVLGLTMAYEEHLAEQMLAAGAVAVIEKTVEFDEFSRAVRAAAGR